MGGSILFNELKFITDQTKQVMKNNFIETGTYKGETAAIMSKHFKEVITMEIHPGTYNIGKKRCAGLKNVNCLLGDSTQHLGNIVDEVKGQGNYYFLDAHGPLVPLLKEMEIILSKEEHKPLVIIIDDYRFFRPGVRPPKDWAAISEESLEAIISKNNFKILSKFESLSDRIVYVLE